VANIEAVTQVVEGCSLKKSAVPDLTEHEKGSFGEVWSYLEAMQRDVLVLRNDTGNAI